MAAALHQLSMPVPQRAARLALHSPAEDLHRRPSCSLVLEAKEHFQGHGVITPQLCYLGLFRLHTGKWNQTGALWGCGVYS